MYLIASSEKTLDATQRMHQDKCINASMPCILSFHELQTLELWTLCASEVNRWHSHLHS